jgi:hypothetical protein
MDRDAFFALVALLALLSASGVGLLGLRMLLNYRIRRLQAQSGAAMAPELEEGLAELKEQMYVLRGDLTELQERVEFAERVLARGRDDARLPGGH